jgi:hypothetical protein
MLSKKYFLEVNWISQRVIFRRRASWPAAAGAAERVGAFRKGDDHWLEGQ